MTAQAATDLERADAHKRREAAKAMSSKRRVDLALINLRFGELQSAIAGMSTSRDARREVDQRLEAVKEAVKDGFAEE